MNRRIWAIVGLIVLGLLLFGAGIAVGQMRELALPWQPGPAMMSNSANMMNGNMMANHTAMMNGAGTMNGAGMMNADMMSMMGGAMMNGQHSGMMGMMGSANADAEITVTAEEAVTLAQEYLDANLPGSTVGEQADACPGHYALLVEQDGQTIGMIGLSAYTGQVFLHQWSSDTSQSN